VVTTTWSNALSTPVGVKSIVEIDKPEKYSVYTPYPHPGSRRTSSDPCIYAVSERGRLILNESGETIEYVYSERLENYVMVPSSVIRRECNPSYVGDVKHPVTPFSFDIPLSCGNQSVISVSPVSYNIPTTTQPLHVCPILLQN